MALIDFNFFQGEPQDDKWVEWLKPTVGVILGFCLGLLPGWIARLIKRNDTYLLFEKQYFAIQNTIKKQIENLDIYLHRLESSNKKNISNGLTICLWSSFDLVKEVDRVDLIKKLKSKHKGNSVNLVAEVFQSYSILEFQSSNLKKYYEEYQVDSENFLNEYLEELNKFQLEINKYRFRIDDTLAKSDEILISLTKIIFDDISTNLSVSEVLGFKTTLHKSLGASQFNNSTHQLFNSIMEFDRKGQVIIGRFLYKKLLHHETIKIITKCFKDEYQFLYESDHKII